MKNKFYLIFLLLIFILSACEDKHQNNEELRTEHQITKTTVKQINSSSKISNDSPKKIIQKEYHYAFKNLKNQLNTLAIKNDIYDFKNIKQSIVIVNIMSTWCPPCRGQIPHLSKLQQKFKENIFVMSILVHDDISKEKLDKFIIAQKILFYVSVSQSENLKFINTLAPKLGLAKDFPMPLTIVFVRGKYFTHYEGMIPEEMIESDIKQLLEKIKK
jgi:thiol-disulfide isomerase/thioredoxin